MMKKLCHLILFRWMKWHVEVTVPEREKCIICVAPHTSNWDFIIAELYYHSLGKKANFLMKKEWFFWPMGCLFRHMGGVPVFRSKKTSLTDQLADFAKGQKHFQLAITPEGTRSPNAEWKKGFYYIALKAQMPILLYAVDYERRLIACTKEIIPSGDIDADMRTIKEYYKDFKGRHPEKFAL